MIKCCFLEQVSARVFAEANLHAAFLERTTAEACLGYYSYCIESSIGTANLESAGKTNVINFTTNFTYDYNWRVFGVVICSDQRQ